MEFGLRETTRVDQIVHGHRSSEGINRPSGPSNPVIGDVAPKEEEPPESFNAEVSNDDTNLGIVGGVSIDLKPLHMVV